MRLYISLRYPLCYFIFQMITCLQQYCEQWKHNPTLAASALLFGSLKERILVSENPSQFNSEVSDLLTSLEHLQLLWQAESTSPLVCEENQR